MQSAYQITFCGNRTIATFLPLAEEFTFQCIHHLAKALSKSGSRRNQQYFQTHWLDERTSKHSTTGDVVESYQIHNATPWPLDSHESKHWMRSNRANINEMKSSYVPLYKRVFYDNRAMCIGESVRCCQFLRQLFCFIRKTVGSSWKLTIFVIHKHVFWIKVSNRKKTN